MKRELVAAAGILMALMTVVPAFAQQEAYEVQYRKWDAGTSFGVLGTSRSDIAETGAYYNRVVTPAWNVDVGRYLTTHLKAEAGLLITGSFNYYVYTQGAGGQVSTYNHRNVRPTSVSGAIAYQFFENVFTHPYISAGVRLISLREDEETTSYDNVTHAVSPSVVTRQTTLQVRPFAAIGCKSYFNESFFMRPELLVAASSRGFSHATVRIGFGFDF